MAQPNTRRVLSLILRAAACVVALWTATVAYGMLKMRSSVVTREAQVDSLRTKADALEAQVNLQRRVARRHHGTINVADVTDTATIADTMNRLAVTAGAGILSMRFMAPEAKEVLRHRKGKPASADASDDSGDTSQIPGNGFESEINGEFGSLVRFLDLVADSPLAVEVVDIDITRTAVDPTTGQSRLSLKLIGRLQP